MPSPFAKIVWNKYEVALLVDACNKVIHGEVLRKDAICRLSKRLRFRMIKNGIEVSEKYRNINGITLQLAIMENILTNGEKGLASSNQLFENIAKISRDNVVKFSALLEEAICMFPEPIGNDEGLEDAIIGQNVFVEDAAPANFRLEDTIKTVLVKKFPKGMRLNSRIDIMRFYNYYKEFVGDDLKITNEELQSYLTSCGIETAGKIYIADNLIPKKLQGEIVSFVEETFAFGRKFVFYESLFSHFKEQLLDTPVATVQLLCAWLRYHYGKSLFFDREYMSQDCYAIPNIDQLVISYMREQWQVKSEEEVVKDLNFLPEEAVRHAFNCNQNILIAATRGMRFHIDKFEVSDEELQEIVGIIEMTIDKLQFIGADELFESIRLRLPQVLNRNSDIPELGIRKVLSVKLGDKYDFNNAVISKKGVKLSARDALIAFAKSHEEFSLDEIDQLAQTLGTVLNYHLIPLLDYCIRINENQFVARYKVHFDIASIDSYLANLIDHHIFCRSLRSIANYSTFPECNYPWTARLLESYLFTESQVYTLYVSDYLNKNKVCGAISFKQSDTSFSILISIALARNNVELTKEAALDFLATEGYIAQRRNSDIETILANARKIRKIDNNQKI